MLNRFKLLTCFITSDCPDFSTAGHTLHPRPVPDPSGESGSQSYAVLLLQVRPPQAIFQRGPGPANGDGNLRNPGLRNRASGQPCELGSPAGGRGIRQPGSV